MNAAWVVAAYHLRRHLLSKGFFLTLIGLPLFMGLSAGVGWLSVANQQPGPIGVLDRAGILQIRSLPEAEDPIPLQLYLSEAEAQVALQAEQIQCLYLLPSDYPQNRQVELRFYNPPDWQSQLYFQNLLRINLLQGQSDQIIARALYPPEITVHSLTTGRAFPADAPSAGNVLPSLAALLYVFALFPLAEILIGALGEEKTNRTMEVLLTSIKPINLIMGKLVVALVILLVEIGFWLLLLLLVIWIGGGWLDIAWLQTIEPNWLDVGQIAVLSLSGWAFYAAALVFVGTLLHQPDEMKQSASLVMLPLFMPLYVLPILIESPDSAVTAWFSLLPFTSVQTLGIRILFEPLPSWQVWTALALNLLGAALFAWLAALTFRRGMLRYGKGLRLADLFQPRRAD